MDNFWNDDTVKAFVQFYNSHNDWIDGIDPIKKKINEFKESKQLKPEWEIIEVNHNVRNTRWNISYWGAADWKEKVLDKLELFKICKVKRLFDGEVFSIGDNTQFGKIIKFTISEEFIHVWFDSKSKWQFLSVIKKVEQPKPLFTTEDGVQLFEGDKMALLNINTWLMSYPVTACEKPFYGVHKEYRYFSNKEAAEQYILENKPCLSLKDIIEGWAGVWNHDNAVTFKKSELYKRYEKLVQSKLKS